MDRESRSPTIDLPTSQSFRNNTNHHVSGLHLLSVMDIAQKIIRKEVSSVEVVEFFIERIEKLDNNVNAVVCRDFQRARQAAEHADASLKIGKCLGKLHGVPVTVKESLNVKGLATTRGVLGDMHPATADSPSVARVKAEGAIVLGKTNVCQNLWDWQSFNEVYGVTNNPWNLKLTPGGSSGGSAAALASGFTPFEIGSDIGGSIRIPSHFCGVFGHKPTHGLVPMEEPIADLSVIGPLAHSAEDLSFLFEVLTQIPRVRFTKRLSDFRVAVWADEPAFFIDKRSRMAMEKTVTALVSAGAHVDMTARPFEDPELSNETYLSLAAAVIASRATDDIFRENSQTVKRLKNAIQRAINNGESADSYISEFFKAHARHHITYREWSKINETRYTLRRKWTEFFKDFDIVLTPISRTVAYPHDHRDGHKPAYIPSKQRKLMVDGVPTKYADNAFWAGLVNMPLLPATAFPTTTANEDGVPVGLQAIGDVNNDYLTMEFAKLMANELHQGVPPPRPPGFEDLRRKSKM